MNIYLRFLAFIESDVVGIGALRRLENKIV